MEARALMRCLRNGVSVPGIRMVDPIDGVLGVELIEGPSVRTVLGGGADGDVEEGGEDEDEAAGDPGAGTEWNDYLSKNQLTPGWLYSYCWVPERSFSLLTNTPFRGDHETHWSRTRQNAHCGYHSW